MCGLELATMKQNLAVGADQNLRHVEGPAVLLREADDHRNAKPQSAFPDPADGFTVHGSRVCVIAGDECGLFVHGMRPEKDRITGKPGLGKADELSPAFRCCL